MLKAILLLPILWAGEVQAPSPEHINSLIEQLGHDTFLRREAAQEELQKIGHPALESLEDNQKHPDLEVRLRVLYILGSHYDVVSSYGHDPLPAIEFMPPKVRFPNGDPHAQRGLYAIGVPVAYNPIDVAEPWMALAIKQKHPYKKQGSVATRLHLKDRMRKGMSRKDAKEFLDAMVRYKIESLNKRVGNW